MSASARHLRKTYIPAACAFPAIGALFCWGAKNRAWQYGSLSGAR